MLTYKESTIMNCDPKHGAQFSLYSEFIINRYRYCYILSYYLFGHYFVASLASASVTVAAASTVASASSSSTICSLTLTTIP